MLSDFRTEVLSHLESTVIESLVSWDSNEVIATATLLICRLHQIHNACLVAGLGNSIVSCLDQSVGMRRSGVVAVSNDEQKSEISCLLFFSITGAIERIELGENASK